MPELSMNAAQQGTPADVTKFAYVNLAPRLSLGVRRQNMKPRAVLPTYVTDEQVVLCKAAPTIRNTYEIRLALFMAVQSGRTFVLSVAPMATVDESLGAHIRQHGGKVARETVITHSVYLGLIDREGEEGDGWVAGDNQSWSSVLAGLRSPWLRDRLRVGGSVPTDELPQFSDLLRKEAIRASNIDDENIHEALLRLAAEGIQSGRSIFVQ
jgi:hypothetical protein